MAQPAASQRLWFRCKPLGYCQGGLDMRLNQPQDRMPPLRAPTPTKMVVVPASVASVLVRCCSRQHRSTSGLLLRTNCMHHRVRRMHGGADDVASGRLERVKARLVQGCCGPHRSTSGLLQCTICVHHIHSGADDATGLSIVALTASAHANRPWQRRPAAPPAHVVLWQPLWSKWRSQRHHSGTSFDASRSATATADSECG